MKKVLLILSLVASSTAVALAQDQSQRIDVRQRSEHYRIQQGRQNGEINPREAVALRHEQRHIRRAEHAARRDGHVSRRERMRLENRQDRASRHIHRARHNSSTN